MLYRAIGLVLDAKLVALLVSNIQEPITDSKSETFAPT
jgi:hypothetical protein